MVYHGEFAEYFIRSFCETVYKYQGADIDENYNIYDVHRMHKKKQLRSLSTFIWTLKRSKIGISLECSPGWSY